MTIVVINNLLLEAGKNSSLFWVLWEPITTEEKPIKSMFSTKQ